MRGIREAALGGSALADTLASVRRHKPAQPLPIVSQLDHQAQLALEATNIATSLAYVREKLSA